MRQKVDSYLDPLAPGQEVTVKNQRISVMAYGETVQKMPIPCTDAVFTTRGDKLLYLGKRSVYPMKGIWCFGGRMFFNDRTPEHSVARCIKRETGVDFDPQRFDFVTTNYYAWVKLAQGNFGGKNVASLYTIEVTPEELHQMRQGLVSSEYDTTFGIRGFMREELVAEKVHPALLKAYDLIFGPN